MTLRAALNRLKCGEEDSSIETLGKRLSRLRIERGLTQGQLALRSHISASYISMLESGKRVSVGYTILERLAKVLDVQVDVLISAGPIPVSKPAVRDLLLQAILVQEETENRLKEHERVTVPWLGYIGGQTYHVRETRNVLVPRKLLKNIKTPGAFTVARGACADMRQGDILLVETDVSTPLQRGGIYVLRRKNGSLFCRRLWLQKEQEVAEKPYGKLRKARLPSGVDVVGRVCLFGGWRNEEGVMIYPIVESHLAGGVADSGHSD